MTSLDEIEVLYYKAMRDARLNEATEGDHGPAGYSTHDFKRWARKVDIFALGEGAADFALEEHQEIIKHFGDYRQNMGQELCRRFVFGGCPMPGQLKDIGSCWDGSKVGAVNEIDSFYVIQRDNVIIERDTEDTGDGLYRVYLQNGTNAREIKPRKIRAAFAEEYSQLLQELELPRCLDHGGYYSSKEHTSGSPVSAAASLHSAGKKQRGYSGVRYNGPAVTSQFISENEALLTWDITPVIVSTDRKVREAVMQSPSMQAIIAENPNKMFPPNDVHLFPDAVADVWRLSTAQLEADTLRVLSSEAPMKKALSFCKVLSSCLKKWSHKSHYTCGPMLDIVKDLDRILAMDDCQEAARSIQVLNRKMRFAHIWIPADMRDIYNEDSKSSISINNAAVKHILLTAGSKMKGAFAPKDDMEMVRDLIRTVYAVLGSDEAYSVDHALLEGVKISHFSVSAAVAPIKQRLAQDIARQCRTLLDEAMTVVRTIHL